MRAPATSLGRRPAPLPGLFPALLRGLLARLRPRLGLAGALAGARISLVAGTVAGAQTSLVAGVLAALLALPAAGGAQITLGSWEGGGATLGGYLRTLTGLHDLGYAPLEGERRSGFHAQVVRLKWKLRLGGSVLLEAHDRIQLQVASSPAGAGGGGAGFGVSVVPGRSLDLSSTFVRQERLKGWHDVDRLSLTVDTRFGDLTVGRQGISWGISALFPVADLWAQFSPFELDTEEKPGSDALRFLAYPRRGVELDLVVADRGSAEELSAGLRATVALPWADLYLAGGKLWNQLMGMGGIAAPRGSWTLRAEGVLPYDLDERDARLPRITVGADRLGSGWMLGGEYHFNGIGAREAARYPAVLQDPRFARGESYQLGRHYLGALASWSPGADRLSLALSALANLQDPSAALIPVLTYDLGQSTRVSAGALLTVGDAPLPLPGAPPGAPPSLRSEYGSYGDLLFTRVSVYF